LNILFGNNLSSYFLSNTSIAISYLVMTMAFLPCAATIMVIKKESSWRVVFIHMLLSFFTCYILATICH
jgi:Fe2+ transport system protein B